VKYTTINTDINGIKKNDPCLNKDHPP